MADPVVRRPASHDGVLSEADIEAARAVADAMGPWTAEQLEELARIASAVPRQVRRRATRF